MAETKIVVGYAAERIKKGDIIRVTLGQIRPVTVARPAPETVIEGTARRMK